MKRRPKLMVTQSPAVVQTQQRQQWIFVLRSKFK
jgi:hypothetical protein